MNRGQKACSGTRHDMRKQPGVMENNGAMPVCNQHSITTHIQKA